MPMVAGIQHPKTCKMGERRANDERRHKVDDLPHALHILFPTSSLLHSGVVDVPQFAQLSGLTTAARPLALAPPVPPAIVSASLAMVVSAASDPDR
jgi:hypothetical protein